MEWFSGLKYKVGLCLVPTNLVTSRLLLGYLLPRHQDLSWILNLMNTTTRFKDKPKSQNQHTVVLSNFETNSSEITRFCRTVVPLFLPPRVVEKSWMKHPLQWYDHINQMFHYPGNAWGRGVVNKGMGGLRGDSHGIYCSRQFTLNRHFLRRLHKHNVS